MSVQQWRESCMREAISLARDGVLKGDGGPFGALIVRGNEIIGRGWNRVVVDLDPTAHAEMGAIRDACRRIGDFRLHGCELYTCCQPCPMCLAAAYWARMEHIWYAADSSDAAAIGFDDRHIQQQIGRAEVLRSLGHGQLLRDEALEVFRLWHALPGREDY